MKGSVRETGQRQKQVGSLIASAAPHLGHDDPRQALRQLERPGGQLCDLALEHCRRWVLQGLLEFEAACTIPDKQALSRQYSKPYSTLRYDHVRIVHGTAVSTEQSTKQRDRRQRQGSESTSSSVAHRSRACRAAGGQSFPNRRSTNPPAGGPPCTPTPPPCHGNNAASFQNDAVIGCVTVADYL